MKEIGAKIRARREELGLELEDVSSKSKISVDKLRNIENGNVAFFRENLSYLKYYVRFYYKEIGLDYNEIRDELNEIVNSYTEEINLEKVEEMSKMQDSINKRVIANSSKSAMKAEKRKIDLNFIIMSVVIVIAVILVVYGGIRLMQSGIFSNITEDENPGDLVVEVVDTPTPTPEIEVTPTPEFVSNIKVNEIDYSNYSVTDYAENEEIRLEVFFITDTWTRVSVNGVIMESPASTIYKNSESIELIVNAEKDLVVSLQLGYFKGNVIKINDTDVVLNSNLAIRESGQTINFKFE